MCYYLNVQFQGQRVNLETKFYVFLNKYLSATKPPLLHHFICSLQRFKEMFVLRPSLIIFCVSVQLIDFSVMIFDASTMNATNSHKRHPFI